MRTDDHTRSTRTRYIAAAALALAGVFGAGVAQARPEIQIPVPAHLPQPPVLHLPHATVRPVPIGITVQSAPVYYEPAYRDHRGPRYQDRHHHRHYDQRTRWDRDGDGIPNRHDRVYNPRWDRDGDGVPNRYDQRPRNPNWR